MPAIPSAAPLLAFLDRGAPYRGRWLIYADGSGSAYAACHELHERANQVRVLDQRRLESMIEARRFSSHLILHGWSPDVLEPDQGYRLLGLGR
jgi:hypothetical protein